MAPFLYGEYIMEKLVDGQIYNVTFQDSLTKAVEVAIMHTTNPMPIGLYKKLLSGKRKGSVILLDTDDIFEALVETESGTFTIPSVAVKRVESV